MTTAAISYRAAHRVSCAWATHRIPWKLLVLAQVIACMGMLVFYLAQVNRLTQDDYTIGYSQKQANALSQENAQLQAVFASAGALGAVQQRASAMGFVKTQSFVYASLSKDGSLASAK